LQRLNATSKTAIAQVQHLAFSQQQNATLTGRLNLNFLDALAQKTNQKKLNTSQTFVPS
jgi:hypothetical protein